MISRRQALIGLAAMAPAPAVVRDRPQRPVVDSLAKLQEAIDNAPPGSRVVLAPGVYEAAAPITIAGKQRITVTSAGVGKATITGPAGFVITDSTHLTVAGFRFTGSATLRVPVGCPQVRITRNHFELTAGDGAHWLNIDGDDATVDHNLFANKPNLGVYLSIVGPSEEVAKRTRIYRNTSSTTPSPEPTEVSRSGSASAHGSASRRTRASSTTCSRSATAIPRRSR